MTDRVTIVGRGLAGSECAWQLAERGIEVRLLEREPDEPIRPKKVHFRGQGHSEAIDLLEEELRRAGSITIAAPEALTARVQAHPRIHVEAQHVQQLPEARPLILACGRLTADPLSKEIAAAAGERHLAYRATCLDSPRALDDALQLVGLPGVFAVGRLTGVEGDIESAACGLVLGVRLACELGGTRAVAPPRTTALGALYAFLRRPSATFEPSNIVWRMFAPLPAGRPSGEDPREALTARALDALEPWLDRVGARLVRAQASGEASTADDDGPGPGLA